MLVKLVFFKTKLVLIRTTLTAKTEKYTIHDNQTIGAAVGAV